MGVTRLLLAACLLASPMARADGEMGPVTINGYQLIDAQYWNFIGDTPFHDPDDILWGFNVSGTTDAGRACALHAFHQLEALFGGHCQQLHDVVALGGTPRFYLWVNDYTAASSTREQRQAELWHADEGGTAGDYSSGAWQWEVTVTQDGSCLTPAPDQVAAALTAALDVLSH